MENDFFQKKKTMPAGVYCQWMGKAFKPGKNFLKAPSKGIEKLCESKGFTEWAAFKQVLFKEDFRGRRRFELRLQAKFSRTIRKYGDCAADPWGGG